MLFIGGAYIHVDAQEKDFFDGGAIDEGFVEVVETMPEVLFEQYDNIIDIQTTALSGKGRASGGIEAYEYNEDGIMNIVNCEGTLTRIVYQEEAEQPGMEGVSSLYILIASSDKTSTDSTTEDGVTLNGCITWIDHLGMSNELVALSGSREGTYTGEGTYVCTSRTHGVGSGKFDGDSFETYSYKGEKGYSFTLIVRSKTQNGNSVQLQVNTSMFD